MYIGQLVTSSMLVKKGYRLSWYYISGSIVKEAGHFQRGATKTNVTFLMPLY